MQGVITYVYDPNSSTACTTSFLNIPETLGLAPYYPRILSSCAQFFHVF